MRLHHWHRCFGGTFLATGIHWSRRFVCASFLDLCVCAWVSFSFCMCTLRCACMCSCVFHDCSCLHVAARICVHCASVVAMRMRLATFCACVPVTSVYRHRLPGRKCRHFGGVLDGPIRTVCPRAPRRRAHLLDGMRACQQRVHRGGTVAWQPLLESGRACAARVGAVAIHCALLRDILVSQLRFVFRRPD